MFSVGGIHAHIKSFSSSLKEANLTDSELFFVKVDVRSCFDSLPQDLVVGLVEKMMSFEDYSIARHTEFKESYGMIGGARSVAQSKPLKKFHAMAHPNEGSGSFCKIIEKDQASSAKKTVFVDSVMKQLLHRQQIMDLLTEHIQNNVIKIGKKYYRQRQGIPQGSVLSSILCSIGYANFERKHLQFLSRGPCLLLRLIDDFLLITPSKSQAERFLNVMHAGCPEYGISIKQEKTLTNVAMMVNDMTCPNVSVGHRFPYCGLLIDDETLNVSKDQASARRPSESKYGYG